MLRLVRLVFLLLAAFVAGIVYERTQASERCLLRAGDWQAGLCLEKR